MIYFYIFAILSLFAFLEIFYKRLHIPIFSFSFACYIIICFTFLRDGVGKDWNNYVDIYNHSNYIDIEVGYKYINHLFSSNKIEFNYFLLLISTSCVTLIAIALNKQVKYKIIAILVIFSDLYLYFNFSGMRQGIALAFILLSMSFIYNKKIILFIFTILIASLFHKTALVFLFAYSVNYINLTSKNNIIILTFCMALALLFNEYIINYISTNFNTHSTNLYFSSEYNNASLSDYITGLLKRSLPLLIIFIFKPFDKNNNIYVNIYIIGFIFYVFFYLLLPDIAVRISSYYIICDSIIYSLILSSVNLNRNRKFLIFSLILIAYGYKVYTYSLLPSFFYNSILSI